MTKKAGIWIDAKRAVITFMDNKGLSQKEILSGIESFKVAGGYGSSTPYGAQDATSESKFTAKKQQALRQYFKSIIQLTKSCNLIYIFGPSESKTGLQKAYGQSTVFKGKISAVEASDSMTDKQIAARVRKFFEQ